MSTVQGLDSKSTSNRQQPKPVKGVYEKQTGSNVWWIRYADHDGRIRREKVGTRSSAISLYQKRKTEVLEGRKFPERLREKGVTFGSLAQDALEYSNTHKISYPQDSHRMKPLVKVFGARIAETITPLEIEKWLMTKTEENSWKPATANRYKALLSLVFRLGVENGKINSNPARLVRRRREDNGRVRWLTEEEEFSLRKVLKRDFPEHISELEIALNTGLRRSEQYRLTWECVNFSQQILTIPRTKNGESRYIALNSTAVKVLMTLHKRSLGSGPVFLGEHGVQLMSSRHWFDKAVKLAGLQNFTWHCLRHTFASRLIMAGVDLRTVQELMGHKTIQMTCRYAHLAPKHQLAAVERLCVPPENPKGPGPARRSMRLVKSSTNNNPKRAAVAAN